MSGLTKGRQMIELTDAMGVQVAVVGNHEFDFGPELAAERIRASSYLLARHQRAGPGRRARLGMRRPAADRGRGLQARLLRRADPGDRDPVAPGPAISFASPGIVAEAAVRLLREMGADLVVAMTHLYSMDDRNLLTAVDGIDLVLGGHDHIKPSRYALWLNHNRRAEEKRGKKERKKEIRKKDKK